MVFDADHWTWCNHETWKSYLNLESYKYIYHDACFVVLQVKIDLEGFEHFVISLLFFFFNNSMFS